MATDPKIAPCPKYKTDESMAVYLYGDSGNTYHVECDRYMYLGPGEGSRRKAIKSHNAKALKEADNG